MTPRYPGIAVVVLALVTSPLTARSEAMLSFGAPYFRQGALTEAAFHCAVPSTTEEMYVSIRTDIDIPGFLGFDLLLMATAGEGGGYPPSPGPPPPPEPIRPFWQFDDAGCNAGALTFDTSLPPGAAGYPSVWQGGLGQLLGFAQSYPLVNQTRMALVVISPAGRPGITLRAGTWYYAGRIKISLCNPGACVGCDQPLAFTLGFARVYGGANAEIEDVIYYSDCVAINGSSRCTVSAAVVPGEIQWVEPGPLKPRAHFADVCNAVETRRSTWGELKLMYR